MAVPTRRSRNASPLADLVGKTVGDAFARQGFAAVEIVTHWQEIVGENLAKRSEPIKLTWPRRDDPDSVGVLQIRVEGAYALEIQHLQPVIVERIAASGMCVMRHVRSPSRRRNRASVAVAKMAHIATTPKGENNVGARNRIASSMSGGLVTQSPATWTMIATTSAPPTNRCTRRARKADNPGRYPAINRG